MTGAKARGSAEGRAKAHATRVQRSRLALLEALEQLVVEQFGKTGTGMLVTPQQVAARAGVSVSTLYNRFPGSLGEIASEAATLMERRGESPHPHLTALGAAHTAQQLTSSNMADQFAARLRLIPSSPSELEPAHREILDSLLEETDLLDLPLVLKADLHAKLAALEIGPKETWFSHWAEALELYRQVPDSGHEQAKCLIGMINNSSAMGSFPVGAEAWSAQRSLLAEAQKLLPTSEDAGPRLWVQLDLALADRALAINDTSIGEILLESIRAVNEVKKARHISASTWSALLVPAVLAAQIGFLERDEVLEIQDIAVRAVKQRDDGFWPAQISQLALANLTAEGVVKTLDDLVDQGYIGPEGFTSPSLLWSPYNLITRRRLGLSNTRLAERRFVENVQKSLVLMPLEMEGIAGDLGIDLEAPVQEVAESDDPAASVIEELARVTKELMVIQPQSPELRRKGLAWQRLIFDELLDPL